jgi:hypothetical protein
MVRRWRLIGYFPILYNPTRPREGGLAHRAGTPRTNLAKRCVCFRGRAGETRGTASEEQSSTREATRMQGPVEGIVETLDTLRARRVLVYKPIAELIDQLNR